MKEIFKKQNGITLIVLIITIILLLIIAGVAISITIDGNLFNRANKAVSDTNKKVAQVQSETDRLISEWDKIENGTSGGTSSGSNTTGGSSSGSGNTTGDNTTGGSTTDPDPTPDPAPDRNFLQVGDYINYTPDTASAYSLEAGVSGYSSNQSIAQETLKWRVMNINADGSVDLISAAPTSKTVYFNGSLGYNNVVYVLNNLCKEQYSNDSLKATARSINLEDIEKKFNSAGIAARDAYTTTVQKYGNSKTYSGTSSYAPDIYSRVGITAAEESKDYYSSPTTATHEQKGTLEVKQTYYHISVSANYMNDKTFHQLVFGTGTVYWLASRYADCGSTIAIFGLRAVNNSDIGARSLFSSNNNSTSGGFRVRPVVSLGSNVKISSEGGSEDSPREISL